MKKIHTSIACILLLAASFSCKGQVTSGEPVEYNDALLQKIKTAAGAIPGALPLSINYLKYASSIRKCKDVVEGGANEDCVMARTVFQVEFADGWIMVDAGMDRAVHRFFEREKPQPFDDSGARRVALAVQQAKLIVITHEHGDHVAGVIRNASDQITGKTILTRQQADALTNKPQMPEIRLDQNRMKDYMIVDFESVLPVAPGIVLIKAPGHTQGEIMIYAKLQNGREYIFTGDVSWSYSGIRDKKQKPESERKRIGENTGLIEQQLSWLNERLTRDNMVILVSHDDIMLPQLAAQGVIRQGLK